MEVFESAAEEILLEALAVFTFDDEREIDADWTVDCGYWILGVVLTTEGDRETAADWTVAWTLKTLWVGTFDGDREIAAEAALEFEREILADIELEADKEPELEFNWLVFWFWSIDASLR